MSLNRCLRQLKEHEGLRLLPYRCSKGKSTIGFGRNFENNPLSESEELVILLAYRGMFESKFEERFAERDFTESPMTVDETRELLNSGCFTKKHARMLLRNDVSRVSDKLQEKLDWIGSLDEARVAVLINMAFQMGVTGLMGFEKTLRYVANGDYADAAKEMLNSRWARQTPSRAKELSKQMHLGEWT